MKCRGGHKGPGVENFSYPYLQVPCNIYEGLTTGETKTGHVAIYIGQRDGEEKIIEAGRKL